MAHVSASPIEGRAAPQKEELAGSQIRGAYVTPRRARWPPGVRAQKAAAQPARAGTLGHPGVRYDDPSVKITTASQGRVSEAKNAEAASNLAAAGRSSRTSGEGYARQSSVLI